MGLLDALFPSSDGGGLLDFLKNNASASIANNPGAMASDTAQYGAPPMPAAYQPGQVQAAPIAAPGAAPGWNSPWPQDSMHWPQGPIGAPGQPPAPAQSSALALAPQGAQPAPQLGLPPPQDASPLSGAQNFFNRTADALGSISRGGSMLGAVRGQFDDPRSQAAAQSNMTARALVAKGVDPQVAIAAVQPGNAEMLKTLVDQKFGAPKPPTVIGNGYVYNPQTNKIERAYEPDAKAPTSLGEGYIWNPSTEKVERAYAPEGKIPIGFQKKTDGSGLEPIPNGPADPAYIRSKTEAQKTTPNGNQVLGRGGEIIHTNPDGSVTVVHKNETAEEANLSDGTVKGLASQYLAGDRTVLQNLGRGAQGAANIVKIREEINKQAQAAGLDGKAIVNNFNEQAGALAGQRSIGTRAANISLAANEANNMIPIALDASAKVPRGEWMPWNKMVQAYQTGSSSPELARFVAATNSLVNSYVRAVSPSGVPTDSMREHAYSMLNSAQSPRAYEAVTQIMQDEMKAAMAAPGQVRKELRHEDNGGGSQPATPPAPGSYVWTPDKGLQPK